MPRRSYGRRKAGQVHRWAHDTTRRLRPQLSQTQTHRADLWLAEEHGDAAQTASPRSSTGAVDLYAGSERLQSGAYEDADRSVRISYSRSVPRPARNATKSTI